MHQNNIDYKAGLHFDDIKLHFRLVRHELNSIFAEPENSHQAG
jgi:hypothetical protein